MPPMEKTLDFPGRRVLVTGASRGIGRAIALAFAGSGAGVSICARGAADLEKTRSEIAARGVPAYAARCDLRDAADVERMVRDAGRALGGIDVLVNNASGFGAGDGEDAWEASLSVDVLSAVRASRAALPHLEGRPGATILHIASIWGFRHSARVPAYAAAKAAIMNYTASQAAALAPRRIRVNAIAPGSIEFPGGTWEKRRLAADPLYATVVATIPWGRMGTPEEVADVALFLASPQARWITGQTIAVDGGQLLGG